MDFRILGPLEISRDGVPVEVGGGQQAVLLALLLLHANETVSPDALIDALWGERPPASAPKSLQILVSRLRKTLGDGVVETGPRGYILNVAAGELDVDRFQREVEEGRRALAEGDAQRARRSLGDALELWRGPPLAEFTYASFAQDEIARLEELRLAALEDRIEADLALARHRQVLPELEQLVRRHPLRERLLGQLMLALYRSGRQAEALAVYRDRRSTLATELGIEPSPPLRELERAILNQDEALAAPKPPPAPLVERLRRRPRLALVAAGSLLAAAALATVLATTLGGSGQATIFRVAPNSVGVIDPKTNALVGDVRLDSPPTRVAAAASGVWVITNNDRVLWHIDPNSRTIVSTVTLDGAASGLSVGPNAVWVLNAVGSGGYPGPEVEASHIDPTYGDVLSTFATGTEYTDIIEGPLAAGPDGAIWAVDENGPRGWDLLRVDQRTHAVRRVLGAGGNDVAVGAGSVWSAGTPPGTPGGLGQQVARIDPGTLGVVARIDTGPTGGPTPAAATIGDGSVWSANGYPEHCPLFKPCLLPPLRPGTVTRIDPAADAVVATIAVGVRPVGIAVGEGGVWVANRSGKSISRIDPKTNRVVATIKLSNRPAGIAAGDGKVWVTVG